MKKLDNILVKTLYYVCGLLMFLMVSVVTAQVISRYLFNSPFTWTEELARYTFVWVSFLGMAIAVKYGSHIALDMLARKLTGISRKSLMVFNNLLVLVFSGILTYSGFEFVKLGARQTSPSLSLPMDIVYLVIPISGILLIYFVLSETIQNIMKKGDE
ncbi:TRAP transporter small permease [Ornithinibacillus sp. 179-J 7C1 HS]|uniref:TRAP transporter small permease n=1 Tax=Ornithinibacillus sp. 179-J 7C1 HS TaxID=3142384 RepID=UPI0039A0A243